MAALFALVGRLAAADRYTVVPAVLLDGLSAIADGAPPHARATVVVHADCHWGNWLASGGSITSLLDFEWARLGEPADDWFFVIAFSGAHMETVLDVIDGSPLGRMRSPASRLPRLRHPARADPPR